MADGHVPGKWLFRVRVFAYGQHHDSVWTTHITDAQTLWDVLASNVQAVSALRPAANTTCPR